MMEHAAGHHKERKGALVLARYADQVVDIVAADGSLLCAVKVLRIQGGRVLLGFNAPISVNIVRRELVAEGDACGRSKSK